jgi:hypothetical protein
MLAPGFKAGFDGIIGKLRVSISRSEQKTGQTGGWTAELGQADLEPAKLASLEVSEPGEEFGQRGQTMSREGAWLDLQILNRSDSIEVIETGVLRRCGAEKYPRTRSG